PQATAAEPAQLPVLLPVRVDQLHLLVAQAVQRLGLLCPHPRPQRLDQLLVLLTRYRPPRLRRPCAPRPLRTRSAMLRRAAVTPHPDRAADTLLLPRLLELQAVPLRANVALLCRLPVKLTLGDLLGIGHPVPGHRRVQR